MGSREIEFTGNDRFSAAPVVWFNEGGQVAAIGEGEWSTRRRLRRVDIVDDDGCFVGHGSTGVAGVLFLRYAFAMASRRTSWINLAPRIVVVSDKSQHGSA